MEKKDFGIVKFSEEKKEYCYIYNVNLDKEAENKLIKYARENIVKDIPHLIEYAIQKGLQNRIDALKDKEKLLKSFVKKRK